MVFSVLNVPVGKYSLQAQLITRFGGGFSIAAFAAEFVAIPVSLTIR